MNTADKLVEIAENVSKVHDVGVSEGISIGRDIGYGIGYDEGVTKGHIDIIDELLGGAW